MSNKLSSVESCVCLDFETFCSCLRIIFLNQLRKPGLVLFAVGRRGSKSEELLGVHLCGQIFPLRFHWLHPLSGEISDWLKKIICFSSFWRCIMQFPPPFHYLLWSKSIQSFGALSRCIFLTRNRLPDWKDTM